MRYAVSVRSSASYYGGVDIDRVNKSTVSGYPSDTYTTPNDFIQKLNGAGPKIGTNMVLKVMAGDKVNLFAKSWYKKNGVTPGTPVNPLTNILNVLEPAIGGITASHGGATLTELQTTSVLDNQVTGFLNSQSGYTTSKPKAFVNWVLFDEQFSYVAASSGFEQVGADNTLTTHAPAALNISKGGYLYIYVSNETPNVDVFFDNLQVTHIGGPILEETHYYPFGLTMAGISSKALAFGSPENKKKYQGYESNRDFDLNTYETFYRTHDPQIGRWWQIDPKPESALQYSPYVSMNNNPISLTDFLGDIVEYERGEGVSKKEFRQFKREIRQMKRNSSTFGAMFKEFKKDKNTTYTYVARNHKDGGGYNKVEGGYKIGIGIHSDMGQKNGTQNRVGIVAHESGHVWRKKHNLDPAMPTFPTLSAPQNAQMQNANNAALSSYNESFVNARNTSELGASHIENMVLSELMNSNKAAYNGLDLRGTYYGGLQLTTNVVNGQIVRDKREADLNTLQSPRDRNYYLNTKFNLYKDHGIPQPEDE